MQHDAMRQLGIEDHDQAPPLDNFTEGAEKRVRLSLLIQQLVTDNNIELDASRIRERVEQICAGYENAEEMVQNYMSTPQVMERLEPMVTEEQFDPWQEHDRTFIEAVRTDDASALRNDYRDGLQTIGAILAAWTSAREGGRCIDVQDFIATA